MGHVMHLPTEPVGVGAQVYKSVSQTVEESTGLVGYVVAKQALRNGRRSRRRSRRGEGRPKDSLTYERPKPRKQPRPRRPVSQREKRAFVKLYELGYPINQIAEALGRSPSVVWRHISKYYRWGLLRRRGYGPQDLRKLPRRLRELSARRRWQELLRYLPLWLAWIEGEGGEEPP